MTVLTYAKSKEFMLDWLGNESRQDIISVIGHINDSDDFDYWISVSGCKSDLISNLSDVPKNVLWSAIDDVFPDKDEDDDEDSDNDDWIINKDSSKIEMLDWLEDEHRDEILSVINFINDGDDYDYKLNVSGSKSDLISNLSDVPRNVLWNAIDDVIPDIDADADADDDEEEDEEEDVDFGDFQKEGLSSRQTKKRTDLNVVYPQDISCESYDLSILNLDQAPEQFLKRVSNFYNLRNSNLGVENLTILFSGPSGAGKTQLVKFLSKKLNRAVMYLSASSFLSPYVGGTEKKTKDIFEIAEKEDFIVFIDEIEGLLQSRSGADKSWELTQVNELLVRLEKFKGVCIGATNLYQSLDPAFYRRFTLKIDFSFMKKESRFPYLKLRFNNILSTGDFSSSEEQLKNLNYLTPGDIEAVYRRLILDGVKYSADQIVSEISREVSLKKHVFQKKIDLN